MSEEYKDTWKEGGDTSTVFRLSCVPLPYAEGKVPQRPRYRVQQEAHEPEAVGPVLGSVFSLPPSHCPWIWGVVAPKCLAPSMV